MKTYLYFIYFTQRKNYLNQRNVALNSSYQIFFRSKELFLGTKMIFSSEMHYFLIQEKFLWIESIFDRTYSVLHFFDSSNFFSLCKIYKIQICFYQAKFLFYTRLTGLHGISELYVETGTRNTWREVRKSRSTVSALPRMHCTHLCRVYLFEFKKQFSFS